MNKTLFAPVLVLTAVGLALPVTGCAKHQLIVAAMPTPVLAPVPVAAAPAPEPPLTINLPGELEFDFDKATIKNTPASTELLAKLADVMKQNPRITKLRIEGHTDNSGRSYSNQWLSQQRANVVARWLSQHDVDGTRLATVGFGQTRPLVDNDSEAHRRMNRRTEFHVQEIDGEPTEDFDSLASATRERAPLVTSFPGSRPPRE